MLATVIINVIIQKHKFGNGVTIGFVANVGTENKENTQLVFLINNIIVANVQVLLSVAAFEIQKFK
jgi:hypothetical protein